MLNQLASIPHCGAKLIQRKMRILFENRIQGKPGLQHFEDQVHGNAGSRDDGKPVHHFRVSLDAARSLNHMRMASLPLTLSDDKLAVFLETCQVPLDRIDGHLPRLAQRTPPRNTSGKGGDEYGVAALGFRTQNDLKTHGPIVREYAAWFKPHAR